MSLVEVVARRVSDCQQLERVLVLTGDGPDDALNAELVPPDLQVFVSPRRDMLGRFVSALDATGAEAAVRVCINNPFVDPVLIDRLVTTAEMHPECDYISFSSRDGRPSIHSPVGVFAEWFRAEALRQADREAVSVADREQVTRFLYSHPERFKLRFIPVPPELDRDDLRLAAGDDEAWEHAQTIYDALGPEGLDWRRIAGLLDRRPAFREQVAAANRERAAL